jgi:hypothetical protein
MTEVRYLEEQVGIANKAPAAESAAEETPVEN